MSLSQQQIQHAGADLRQRSQTDTGSASSLSFTGLSLLPRRAQATKTQTLPSQAAPKAVARLQHSPAPLRLPQGMVYLTAPAHLLLGKSGNITGRFHPVEVCQLSLVHSWSNRVSSLAPPGIRTSPLGGQQ